MKPSYPIHTFGNNNFNIRWYLPDADSGFYRGARFDHSSAVQQLTFKGHTCFGPIHQEPHNPYGHDNITGFAEEYRTPCTSENHLLKIGVGILHRPDKADYSFAKTYSIEEPGIWEILPDNTGFACTHTITHPIHGYILHKSVRINNTSLTIQRTLTNTGSQYINTIFYVHNFFIINHQPIGPAYTLQLPFLPAQSLDLNNSHAIIHNKTIRFPHELTQTFTQSFSGTSFTPHHGFTLQDTNIRITHTGTLPIEECFLFAIPQAVCPECIVRITLKPDESISWKDTYTFSLCNAS